MNTTELKVTLKRRLSLDDNDDAGLSKCWKSEADILSEDVNNTIEFFKSCTDEEFVWLGEVFDDIIARTQSRKLFSEILERAEKIRDPELRNEVKPDIEFASEQFME